MEAPWTRAQSWERLPLHSRAQHLLSLTFTDSREEGVLLFPFGIWGNQDPNSRLTHSGSQVLTADSASLGQRRRQKAHSREESLEGQREKVPGLCTFGCSSCCFFPLVTRFLAGSCFWKAGLEL